MFPSHIDRILTQFGVAADTKAALYDLYVSMGDEVLEVFGEIAETFGSVSELTPEETLPIRRRVVERYLRRNHPRWVEGTPTPSLWHPREAEGRASGLAMPLLPLDEATVRSVIGDSQPMPEGIVMLGRNAHFGGRAETVSFDVVAADVEDAIAIGTAEGQQHTMPGSVGETSGTFDAINGVALIWEIQPNVFKPAGERNRAISKVYRRHRNWHILTLIAALRWLADRNCCIFVLRGAALATTHEVNPAKPVSETIVSHHDRTVEEVAGALGYQLAELDAADEELLVTSAVMNHALTQHVEREGAGHTMWRVVRS
ncbi:MAG: hypothetical protein ACXW3E_15540 [Thermoanaerobaculia bacterium]